MRLMTGASRAALVVPSVLGLIACVLGSVASLSWPTSAAAQTVPANCWPNTGGQKYQCAARFPVHYRYAVGNCGGPGHVQWSQGAAHSVFESFMEDSNEPCPVNISQQGWISPGSPKSVPTDFSVACGGSGTYPGMYLNGQEAFNWLLDDVTKWSPAPSCQNSQDYVYGAARREREFLCPEGMGTLTADVCYRSVGQLEHAKNLGRHCPPGECRTKHPINFGQSNKFREEIDYRSPGNSTLAFVRYYNSFPHNANLVSQYYDQNFEVNSGYGPGTNGYAYGSAEPSEQSTRYGVISLGAIGVGWRHTYQRMIVRETSTLVLSAFAFREDGRILIFTKMSGQWYAQIDVPYRLEETVDGGGAQTGWKLTQPDSSTETYDLTGRLLTIRTRGGIQQTLGYDDCGRVTSVTDSFGRALGISYTSGCALY